MKIKSRSDQNNLGRTVLVALVGLVLVGAMVVLPICRALSQSGAGEVAQMFRPLDSLPARLQVNPEGSVTVSFQGKRGATYQIYFASELPTWLNEIPWTLVADDVPPSTNTWTQWVDVDGAKRSRPAMHRQGFYRVVLKAPKITKPKPTSLAFASTGTNESTSLDPQTALKAMRKREMTELTNLIAGGPQMETALTQKVEETPLDANYLLEVLKGLTSFDQQWAREIILEAVVGPKATDLKVKQFARVHLLLGSVYASTKRYPEAIQHFLEVPRIRPNSLQGWEGFCDAGLMYRLEKNFTEARRCLSQVAGRPEAERWGQQAQWLIGMSYRDQRDFAHAFEEFKKLAETTYAEMFRADAYYWMGDALAEMQRWDEAYAAYRKVIQLNGDLPRSSPFRSQYNRAEKFARAGWARIGSHLSPESSKAGSSTEEK